MRKMFAIIGAVMLFAGLLVGCGRTEAITTEDIEFRALGDTTMSLEQQQQGLSDTASYVKEYYERIYSLAHEDGAPKKAAKKIEKIQSKYEADINAYAEMDFAGTTQEEIADYNTKLCDLITAIREVDDIITFGK